MSDQLDHIEKYIKGALSGDDLEAFESEMQNDASLAEKVDNHRQLLKGLEIGFNLELKSMLQKEEAKFKQAPVKEPKRTKSFYILFGMAAAVSVLIVSVFVLQNRNLSNEQLFAQYYETYPNVEQPVSRSEKNVENPYALYESGAYEKALLMFEDIIDEHSEDQAALFYAGISSMEMHNAEAAITYLNNSIDANQKKYTRPAYWYLALAYLDNGQPENAKNTLDNLVSGEDKYAARATELLSFL